LWSAASRLSGMRGETARADRLEQALKRADELLQEVIE